MNISIPNEEAKEISAVLSRLLKSNRMLDTRTIEPTYNEVMALITLQSEIFKQL